MMESKLVDNQDILSLRDMYRHEMNCQIVHDSLHSRQGWTHSYALCINETVAGYGAVLVGGPWQGSKTVFEFYVSPPYRSHQFELFRAFANASQCTHLEGQTNDPFFSSILHAFGTELSTESILFHDIHTTRLYSEGAAFRRVEASDRISINRHDLDDSAEWIVDVNGDAVAAGDILFHYNRPYGDIYMKVAEPFRRQGIGSYLVQELKRICYEQGSIPGARCNPANEASRKTLQRAGFGPCGFIVNARLDLSTV